MARMEQRPQAQPVPGFLSSSFGAGLLCRRSHSLCPASQLPVELFRLGPASRPCPVPTPRRLAKTRIGDSYVLGDAVEWGAAQPPNRPLMLLHPLSTPEQPPPHACRQMLTSARAPCPLPAHDYGTLSSTDCLEYLRSRSCRCTRVALSLEPLKSPRMQLCDLLLHTKYPSNACRQHQCLRGNSASCSIRLGILRHITGDRYLRVPSRHLVLRGALCESLQHLGSSAATEHCILDCVLCLSPKS